MNLKQFEYVIELARRGSFSKAADSLNIRQPSLSQYIRKIEQELGVELFDRSGGNVRLTDAGQAYLEAGRKMLELERSLEAALKDISECRTGTITVGISAHKSVALMPRIVKEFRSRYPGMVLHIEERKRTEIMDAAFDFCITTRPVDEDLFVSEPVFREEILLAVPAEKELPAEERKDRLCPAVPVSALNYLPFAELSEEHPIQQRLEKLSRHYGLHIHAAVVCSSLNASLEMVRAGVGAALIPSSMAEEQPGVRFYSLQEELVSRGIVLCYRREQYISHAVRELMDLIRETYKDKPAAEKD